MTLTEFLLDRIAEEEVIRRRILDRAGFAKILMGGKEDYVDPHAERLLSDLDAKRRIVEFHKSWPVLVETPPTFETVGDALDIDSVTFRASQQMAWFTQEEYRKRFGDEPPTAPMLATMAEVYADHPDYDEAWRP